MRTNACSAIHQFNSSAKSNANPNDHLKMQRILDSFLKVEKAPEAADTAAASAQPEETCLECSTTEVFTSQYCSTAGCKRRRTKECATGLCFPCCYELKAPCAGHFRMRKKREEEDRYIAEGMRSSSRQKTSFYHYEEKFMKCDQTVVIWCLQDFLFTKKWSADTMAQYKREQRTLDLLRRRHGESAVDLPSRSSSSSLAATAVSSTSSRKALTSKSAVVSTSAVASPSASSAASPKKRGRPAAAGKSAAVIASPSTSTTAVKKVASVVSSLSGKSAHLTKTEKRFLKVKEMWNEKFKLRAK